MSKLVDLVASAETLAAGATALVRGLAPELSNDEVRELVGALTVGTAHIAIRPDHPGFARAQQIFEGGELDAAAQLERAEVRLAAEQENNNDLATQLATVRAALATEQTNAEIRAAEHAAAIASRDQRIGELQAAAESAPPIRRRLVQGQPR